MVRVYRRRSPLFALLLAVASVSVAQPPPQGTSRQGGIVVQLPVERKVSEMSEAEIMAGELGGSLTEVSGRNAVIAVHHDCVPRVGDPVEFLSVKSGFAASIGHGRITYADGDTVRAAMMDGAGDLAPGMVAIIQSAIPAGALSHIGFENTPRPQLPTLEMIQWADRHVELVGRANQSFADAQRLLSVSPPDMEQAVVSLRRAAELNHVEASFTLFRIYKRGEPAVLGKSEALQWLRRAAELGNSEAQAVLGEAYEGRNALLPANLVNALAWYRKAAAMGSERAKLRLREIGGGRAGPG